MPIVVIKRKQKSRKVINTRFRMVVPKTQEERGQGMGESASLDTIDWGRGDSGEYTYYIIKNSSMPSQSWVDDECFIRQDYS